MKKPIVLTIAGLSLAMALFHLYAAGVQLFPAIQQRSAHLGFALAITFLLYPFLTKHKKDNLEDTLKAQNILNLSINILLAVAGGLSAIYIFMNHIDLARSLSWPPTFVVIIATTIILLVLESSRRTVGWGLPAVAIAFLIYAFFGQHLPMMFVHSGYTFEKIVTQVGLSTEGILGISLGVSATYIVLFVIFGSLLEKSGTGQLFMNLAIGLVGRFRGGAAKVSVVSSAFFGSISGSPTSNVVTTGVLTIPLMKREGYKSEFAGAVEAIASTGGMFLPPVMGAVSFLMADYLGVDYVQIMLASLIPAILYFIAVFLMVDLRAVKLGMHGKKSYEGPDLKKELITKGHLLIPLFLLVYLLVIERLSPTLSVFWAIVSIPLSSYLRKGTRMGLRDIAEGLKQGIRYSLMVVSACACAGIVIGVINMSGIGLRMSSIMVNLSGENLFLLLILTMICSIVMGLGLPPVASYLILAVFAAPAMIELGVVPIAAHMFIFFYATLAHITPPVAVTIFAASGLAKSNPTKTAFIALRLGVVAFLIPYFFVYGPELLFQGSIANVLYAALTALIGVFILSIAIEGYLRGFLNIWSRILLIISALFLMQVGYVTDIIGAIIFSSVLLFELKKKNTQDEESIPSSKAN